jgi:hypothetical protein
MTWLRVRRLTVMTAAMRGALVITFSSDPVGIGQAPLA